MDRDSKRDVEPVDSGRNYGGVRITPPPRQDSAPGGTGEDLSAEMDRYFSKEPTGRDQARILTGAALFGVVAIVLLHEFGHWLAGLIVTGKAPDFLLVAVRQKVEEFSTIGGVFVWGAGPLLHLAAIWALSIYVTSRSRTHPRLFAIAGGALAFTIFVQLVNWAGATFTPTDSWGNDLPKVATFFGSWARFWMHILSAAFLVALLVPAYVWWVVARSTGHQGLFLTPTVMGAFQGGFLVLIATLFVAFSQ